MFCSLGTVPPVTAPASFELHDVVAGPPDSPILRGVSLQIPCQGVTAFAGPSGAGKSTLLRLLNRLDDPLRGSLRWEGRQVDEWDPQQLRRRVAMIFQRPPLFAGTVHDNLLVAVPDLDRDGALAALDRVGLARELLDRDAADLSGGEAQRMCIARALLTEPAVLLADEPTSSLDGAAQRTIEDLFRSIADDDGVAVLWVTHDVDQLRRIADHVVVVVDGGIAATGHLPELDRHDDPKVRELVGAP
jgi:putative ABC transport system ATP-binding protein